jgi:hypothetical protein
MLFALFLARTSGGRNDQKLMPPSAAGLSFRFINPAPLLREGVLVMRTMNRMDARKTALERAFEIARTGRWERVEDIRRQLLQEGYNYRQVEGPLLGRQLIEAARLARLAQSAPTLESIVPGR